MAHLIARYNPRFVVTNRGLINHEEFFPEWNGFAVPLRVLPLSVSSTCAVHPLYIKHIRIEIAKLHISFAEAPHKSALCILSIFSTNTISVKIIANCQFLLVVSNSAGVCSHNKQVRKRIDS